MRKLYRNPALFLSLVLLLSALPNLFSIDIRDRGFHIEAENFESAGRRYILTDSYGTRLTVLSSGSISPREANTLTVLSHSFSSIDELRIGSMEVNLRAVPVAIHIDVKRLYYGGSDLRVFLPEGLLFHYFEGLTYEFPMKAGGYRFKLRGYYTDPDDFLKRIENAVSNPKHYALLEDPILLERRLSEIEDMLDSVEAELKSSEERIRSLDHTISGLRQELEAKDKALAKTNSGLADLASEITALKEEQNIERRLDASPLEELVKLRNRKRFEEELLHYAVFFQEHITYLNILNNGKKRPALLRLLRLKQRDPCLKESVAAKLLKAEGLNLAAEEISTVFGHLSF